MKEYLDRAEKIIRRVEDLCVQLCESNAKIVSLYEAIGVSYVPPFPFDAAIKKLLLEMESFHELLHITCNEEMWFCHPHMMPDTDYLMEQLFTLEDKSFAIRDMFCKIREQITTVHHFNAGLAFSKLWAEHEQFYSCWIDEWRRSEVFFSELCKVLFRLMHEWIETVSPSPAIPPAAFSI